MPERFEVYSFLISSWFGGVALLVFGASALLIPGRLLKSQWIQMRIPEGSMSPWATRILFGIPFTAVGIFVFRNAVDATALALAGKLVLTKHGQHIQQPPLANPGAQNPLLLLSLIVCWPIAGLMWANGIFALVSPRRWEAAGWTAKQGLRGRSATAQRTYAVIMCLGGCLAVYVLWGMTLSAGALW